MIYSKVQQLFDKESRAWCFVTIFFLLSEHVEQRRESDSVVEPDGVRSTNLAVLVLPNVGV